MILIYNPFERSLTTQYNKDHSETIGGVEYIGTTSLYHLFKSDISFDFVKSSTTQLRVLKTPFIQHNKYYIALKNL